MSCENQDQWSVRIMGDDGVLMEAQPLSLNLSISRNEFDFCRSKFEWSVGEMMRPHTESSAGELFGLHRADVLLNGEVVQPMLFRPGWVNYTPEGTHVKLHDLHKALDVGEVDIREDKTEIRSIYSRVINSTPNRIIDSVRFATSVNIDRTIYTEASVKGNPTQAGLDANPNSINPDFIPDFLHPKPEPDKVFGVVGEIDFENITPLKAVLELNKEFGFSSWIDNEGTLVVGVPEMDGQKHLAAPDDKRVWRYKDPQISHSSTPVKNVVIKGDWADAAGVETDPRDWFGEQGDARPVGIATRTDVDTGRTITKETGAKKGSLKEIARLTLLEETKELHSGTIKLDPETSGTRVSRVEDVKPGDKIRVVPSEESVRSYPNENCRNVVNNDIYDIYDVKHNISNGGSWLTNLDISIQPDLDIDTKFIYYNPQAGDVTEAFNDPVGDAGLSVLLGLERPKT
jgi:hypothetical protein